MRCFWRLGVWLALLGAACAQTPRSPTKLERGIEADIAALRAPNGREYQSAVQSLRKHLLEPFRLPFFQWSSDIVCQHAGEANNTVARVLIRFLQEPNPDLRRMALISLSCLKGESSLAVAVLIKAVKFDRSADVRLAAIGLLARVADPKLTVPLLLHVLKLDSDRRVQESAADTLARIDKVTKLSGDALLDLVVHPLSPAVRASAIHALVGVKGSEPEVISALNGVILNETDSSVRLEAVKELCGMRKSEYVVSSLISALRREQNVEAQKILIDTLRRMHPVSDDAISALIDAIRLKEAGTDAATAVQEIGFTNEQLGTLIELLNDSDPNVRSRAALALTRKSTGDPPPVQMPLFTPPSPSWLPSPNQSYSRTPGLGSIGGSGVILGDQAVNKVVIEEIMGGKMDEGGGFSFPTSRTVQFTIQPTGEYVSKSLKLLRDNRPEARAAAAYALGEFHGSDDAVSALIRALRDENADVRQAAAAALGSYGGLAKKAVPDLVHLLHDDGSPKVRLAVSNSLCIIGPSTDDVVSDLIRALREDSDENVRASAILSIHCLDPAGKVGLPPIIAALKDPSDPVRIAAFQALGAYGAKAERALPLLTQELRKERVRAEESHQPGRTYYQTESSVAEAIYRIAFSLQEAGDIDAIDNLKAADAALQESAYKGQYEYGVQLWIRYLEALKAASWRGQIESAIKSHPWIGWCLLAVGAYFAFLAALVLTLWLKPLWIYSVDQRLEPFLGEITWRPLGFPLHYLYVLLVGPFRYRSRLLDAWVAENTFRVEVAFARLETVHERRVHLDTPVEMNGRLLPVLTAAALKDEFRKAAVRILVCGIGGVGKTSLACQIAAWSLDSEPSSRIREDVRILPVLIEEDCDSYAGVEESNRLTFIVRDKLRNMIGGGASGRIGEAFVRELLRKQRILVLIDGLSELSSFTKSIIQPGRSDFVANCLVVTTRTEDEFVGGASTLIRPSLLRKDALSAFMGRYLAENGAKNLFGEAEFHETCLELVNMVGGREITAFLAKLYADHVIEAKAKGEHAQKPNNIIDLVLGYVVEMNAKLKENRQDNANVIVASKILAWECLKDHLSPSPGDEESAFTEISNRLCIARGEAIDLVRYFEKRLRLIQSVGSTGERFRFSLDPMAEQLAALHVVEQFGTDTQRWNDLLGKIDRAPRPTVAQGFGAALLDCCSSRGKERGVPAFVGPRLSRYIASISDEMRGSADDQTPETTLKSHTSADFKPLQPGTLHSGAVDERDWRASIGERLSARLRNVRALLSRAAARWRMGWIQFGICVTLITLDQLSKWAVMRRIPLNARVAVIPGSFQLTHVENRGAAFGLWAQSKLFWMPRAVIAFSILALIILAALQWRILKAGRKEYATSFALSLVAGGAAGNLLNRIFLGRVVNFLDFYFGRHHWPAFNLADAAIVIGAILLLYEIAIREISTRNTITRKKAAGA